MLPNRRIHDLYPSRLGDIPSLLRRHDPVTYRLASKGPLTLQQIAHYERYGYLCLLDVLNTSELENLVAAACTLQAQPALRERPEMSSLGDGGLRSIFRPHAFDRTIEAAIGHSSLVRAVEQILASPVYVHQARLDFGSQDAEDGLGWRSDFEQWHVEDGLRRMRTVNIFLNATLEESLCPSLRVIAGSHLHYLSLPGSPPERSAESSVIRLTRAPDLLSCLKSEHGVHEPSAKVGSAVMFDSNLLYAFGLTRSRATWSRLRVAYNSIGNTPVRPFSGEPPRPDFIAERQPRVL